MQNWSIIVSRMGDLKYRQVLKWSGFKSQGPLWVLFSRDENTVKLYVH